MPAKRPSKLEFFRTVREKAQSDEKRGWIWKVIDVVASIVISGIVGTVTGTFTSTWQTGVISSLGFLVVLLCSRVVYYIVDAAYFLHCDLLEKLDASANKDVATTERVRVLENTVNSKPASPELVKQIIEHFIHTGQVLVSGQITQGCNEWNSDSERFVNLALALKHRSDFERYGALPENVANPELRRLGSRINVLRCMLPTFSQSDVRTQCTDNNLLEWKHLV